LGDARLHYLSGLVEGHPRSLPEPKAVDEIDLSLRLPVALLERIKIEANRRDVPYQSLIKIWLQEKAG
jgi:hypothetical protein